MSERHADAVDRYTDSDWRKDALGRNRRQSAATHNGQKAPLRTHRQEPGRGRETAAMTRAAAGKNHVLPCCKVQPERGSTRETPAAAASQHPALIYGKTKCSTASTCLKKYIATNDLTPVMRKIILLFVAVSAANRAASAFDAGTEDRMGWDNRFLGMMAFRRGIALLALALLVMGALARPAIPNLADRASPAADLLLSEEDQRANPVTLPAAWPSTPGSTAVAEIDHMLGESARGVAPIKKPMPLIAAEGQVTALAMPRSFRPDLDRRSSIRISAVGSARIPTGPPLPIA
ncbi:MAG: hypothetical protein R3F54_18210 [Alphaproteobacteria bacterium]